MFIPHWLHWKLFGRFYNGAWHHGLIPHSWCFPIGFDRDGISFQYRGDQIYWLFPWRREYRHHAQFGLLSNPKWLNINLHSLFFTLQEMDDFWEGYWNACRREPSQ